MVGLSVSVRLRDDTVAGEQLGVEGSKHRRRVLIFKELVSAEAIDLVAGQSQLAIFANHGCVPCRVGRSRRERGIRL